MIVKFFATLRAIVGDKSASIPIGADASAQDLLDAVLEHYPDLRSELLDQAGELSRRVHLNINGRNVIYLEKGLATILQREDTIEIFPAVAGG
jgi:molybdopterin synthase sulfur carrier subunit